MPRRELGISNQLVNGELMAGSNSKDSCSNCIYFYDAESNIMGTCRRFPEYKNHHSTDWCGEFSKVIPPPVIKHMVHDLEIASELSEEEKIKRKQVNQEAGTVIPKPKGRPRKHPQ